MRKWSYMMIAAIFITSLLFGCNAQNKEKSKADAVVDKRTNFGENFIEKGNYVAYIKPNNELYVYNHNSEDEFLVHEDVDQFDFVKNNVLYLAKDGVTSELDIELQAIFKTDVRSQVTEKVVEPMEEDGAFSSPRAFYVNDEGFIAIEEQVGFFYSNYWYNYYATDIDFALKSPIITIENEYDNVVNEIQWQGSEIFLLLDRAMSLGAEELQTELHSFSVADGQKLLKEQALPLSSEEYNELVQHTVYIGVAESVLFISAVDDNDVEKIAYEIDLDTNEIIHKTPK